METNTIAQEVAIRLAKAADEMWDGLELKVIEAARKAEAEGLVLWITEPKLNSPEPDVPRPEVSLPDVKLGCQCVTLRPGEDGLPGMVAVNSADLERARAKRGRD